MKIALFSAFYPYRGGIAQFSAQLYRALEKENEVKAFTFTRQYPDFLFPGSTQFVQEKDGCDVIPSERVLDSINPISYSSSARKINAFQPDIFIDQYWMTFLGPSMGKLAKKIDPTAKKIAILHNVLPHERRFFDMPANRYFLKHHDGFVVLSDKVLEDLLLIKPDAKYIRIDHPVYDQFGDRIERQEALKELDLDASKKYLLFFGLIRQYKGLDLLLQAMQEMDNNIHLIIAGEPYENFASYQGIIDSIGLAERVHLFTRFIPDNEVRTFFSAADLCVLPYKHATQSGIIAIANHFCLPVLATNVGGLKESIKDGKNGLVTTLIEPSGLSEKIRVYFEQNLQPLFISELEREQGKNSWKSFADKIIQFAENI